MWERLRSLVSYLVSVTGCSIKSIVSYLLNKVLDMSGAYTMTFVMLAMV